MGRESRKLTDKPLSLKHNIPSEKRVFLLTCMIHIIRFQDLFLLPQIMGNRLWLNQGKALSVLPRILGFKAVSPRL